VIAIAMKSRISSARLRQVRTLPVVLLCTLTVVALLPAFATAAPGRTDDLRTDVERLSESLQLSRGLYDAAAARARSAGREEASLTAMAAADRTRLAELRRQVAANARRAEEAGRSLVRARAVLARRIVAIYMAGSPRIADLLLSSGDYGDLAARSFYLEAIGDSDRALARRVAELRRQRLDSLRAARAGSAEVASRVADLEARAASAAAVRAEAESSAARLAAIESKRSRQIGQLEDRIETIESRRETAGETAEPSFPGGPYSIPTYIVMCESGGNYSALNPSSGAGGAYQIIPSTWEAYGGTGLPHLAPKAEQDRIAALIWANDGPGAWVCA
jgi:alkylhydroperoxidase family enzyme